MLRQTGGTPAARTEREALTVMYRQQLAQLDAAENGLCFGRLEFNDGVRSYIGRLGMHADNENYDQLLMDWRADAARPFYLATAASPGQVKVRRHIKTKARTVQQLDDEILDLAAADPSRHEGVTGESALLAALSASRTGRMRDIVATIQAEQDRIIRSPIAWRARRPGRPRHRQDRGRAAPGRLPAVHPPASSWISAACSSSARTRPSCGTSARCCPRWARPAWCWPPSATCSRVSTRPGPSGPEAARIKGRVTMAKVIANAVLHRQRVPARGPGEVRRRPRRYLHLHRRRWPRPAARARRSRRPHNQARPVFCRVLDALAPQSRNAWAPTRAARNLIGRGRHRATSARVGATTRRSARRSASSGRCSPRSGCWRTCLPPAGCSRPRPPGCREPTATCCCASAGGTWTPADVPLLDEAAELLGDGRPAAKAAAGGGASRKRRTRRACST